jgi:hypothetical protein
LIPIPVSILLLILHPSSWFGFHFPSTPLISISVSAPTLIPDPTIISALISDLTQILVWIFVFDYSFHFNFNFESNFWFWFQIQFWRLLLSFYFYFDYYESVYDFEFNLNFLTLM